MGLATLDDNNTVDEESSNETTQSKRVLSSETVDPLAALNEPCKIVDVRFDGSYKTKPTVLAKIASDVFASSTLQDCLIKSAYVRDNLKSLNIFSDIQIQIEPANKDVQDEFRVVFQVEERGRIAASAHASIDNNSNKLTNIDLTLPNLTGICDHIKLSSKTNTLGFISGKRLHSQECSYSVPIRPWKILFNPIYSLIYSHNQYGSQPSGFDLEDRSIVNQVEFYSTANTHHCINFENIWRHIKTSSANIPIEIREQAGHSVKSALKHTLTWDNRGYRGSFPSSGALARLSNEFTLPLVKDSAKFTRHEVSLQMNARLLPQYDLLGQINLLAGALGGTRSLKFDICDRFFPGGALNMRGFEEQGLGPNIRGRPVGVLSYISVGIHLYPKLPYTTPDMLFYRSIRPHIFFNLGTVGDLNQFRRPTSVDEIKREAHRFNNSLRYSTGFGLVMHAWGLRWEVNYCLPLIAKEDDQLKNGFQWGFGFRYN